MERTVAEIKRGEWFVSMECFFRGFDYGLEYPDGVQRVVARNEETAWLTKHLLQYGGDGVYVDEKTGAEVKLSRVLRNITFSGKGLVRKPANDESVILNSFASVEVFNPASISSEYLTAGHKPSSNELEESISMPETNPAEQALRDENHKLTTRVEELTREVAGLKNKDTEAAISGLKSEVASRDEAIKGLQTELASRDETIAGLNSQLEVVKETSKTFQARAEKAEADLANATEELATVKAAETRRGRLAILTQKGAKADVAEKFVDQLASLDDEKFAETVELVAAAWKPAPAAKREADPVVTAIKKATPEPEPALATASENDSDREQARAAVVTEFISKSLSNARKGRPSVYAVADSE
jgi:hypothetical protein